MKLFNNFNCIFKFLEFKKTINYNKFHRNSMNPINVNKNFN